MYGERTMLFGLGKGLKFDSQGGHAGYALGTSDPLEQKALEAYLKPGGVFYDIGANVGFFATLGGRLAGAGGRVYAFEPFPETARIARANVMRNGFHQVEVIEAAVCDRTGTSTFVLSTGSTTHRLSKVGETPGEKQISVPTVTVDKLVASGRILPPTVVMIDVEGAELEVIRGMAATIARHRPTLICEVHWQKSSTFVAACRAVVGGPDEYEINRLGGGILPDQAERYHVLVRPITPAANTGQFA